MCYKMELAGRPCVGGTSSSSASQQVDQREAVVDSPHTDFYVLGCLSAAVPLFAVVFQLLFCVVDRQKTAVDAVLSHLHSLLLFCAADRLKAAVDAVLSDLHSRLLFYVVD